MVCGVLVRIRSGDGQPLVNVAAKSANNVEQVSDEFGRIWYALAANDKRAISMTKPGYQEQRVELACGETYQETEEIVVLKPADPSTGKANSR